MARVRPRPRSDGEPLRAAWTDGGLERHSQKTKLLSCKDEDRRGTYLEEHVDFLGDPFRPRRSKHRWGKYFINFSPGVRNAAPKAIRPAMRRWQLRCRVDTRIDDLARRFNPIIPGWLNYSPRSYTSALSPTLPHLDRQLARGAMAKYQTLAAASAAGGAVAAACGTSAARPVRARAPLACGGCTIRAG